MTSPTIGHGGIVTRTAAVLCSAITCFAVINLAAGDEPPVEMLRPFEFVVVGPDKMPIPRTEVELRGSPLPTAEQITRGKFVRKHSYGVIVTTDEDGTLVVNRPVNSSHFQINAEMPGFAPYSAGWSNGENSEAIPSRFTAELDAGWSVGGVILDDAGQPVVGVSVRPSVRFKKRPGDLRELGVGTVVKTDAAGHWRYDSVPVSKDAVHVELNHTDFEPDRRSLSRAEFGIGLDQPPVARITLDRGLSVVGTVTDTDGQPIAGATIRTKLINDIRETKTNELGTYRLSGLEPAMARIVVFAPGKATDMRELRLEAGLDPLDFTMSPGGTVRVRVQDEQGRPVPKARIFFQHWRGPFRYFEFNHVSQYADENGVWVWNEAPLDGFEADICPPNGMQLGKQPLLAREEEFLFRTPPALVIRGKVIDAETKQPVKSFTVVPGLRWDDGSIHWSRSEQFAAVDGQYQLRHVHDQEARLVRIEAEGYQPAVSRNIKSDEGQVTIDFELRTGKDLAATVLTSEGVPASNARVALGLAGSQIIVRNGDIDLRQTYCAHRETTAEGKFRFPPEEKPFQIVITHPQGYMYLDATAETFPATITLEPWAKVEGTFRIGKDPVPRVPLSLNPAGFHSYGEGVPHVSTHYESSTDQNGRFVFDRVVPGRARIGRRILLMVNEGAKDIASSSMVPVELPGGKTTHLDLGGEGRPVVAQFEPPPGHQGKVDWAFAIVNVGLAQADLPMPNPPNIPEAIRADVAKRQLWILQWQQTPEGRAWTAYRAVIEEQQRQSDSNPYHWASVDRTGKVRFEDMPAGVYMLSIRFEQNAPGKLHGYRFTIPPMAEPRTDEPLDLGVLTLE